MFAENFKLADYFNRIGYQGAADLNAQTLKNIMQCHLRTIPFENMDVQAGKIISLEPEQIVEKLLQRKRGGYCYEVNGLFAMALQALGVNYTLLGARPMFYPTRRPKTHMVVLAEVDQDQWLCDVGFGSYGISAPMRLSDAGNEIQQGFDRFRLDPLNEREFVLKAWVDNDWTNQYSFDLYPHEMIDFLPANYFNSTSPDAVFVQKPLIVLHTEAGRKILFGDNFKRITANGTEQINVPPEQLREVLASEFNLLNL